jgi:beta-1,4-mannosyltransferase
MLVQNPPSVPTLLVATLICRLRNTNLIIDWHNFGYTILALKLGPKHPLVRISKQYEFLIARLAHTHLTVTSAMARILHSKLDTPTTKARILTLHDRPAPHFKPLDQHSRLAFLQRYNTLADHYTTLCTQQTRLLVSSTSWTPDEDFSLLLEALVTYSARTSTHPRFPELIVVITGKGPLKQHYLEKIGELRRQDKLDQVHIYTDFLSFADYASLLGASDLGISLHTSSSGVDLPMKVVDMFGAGLPVLGVEFQAWSELVQEGVTGYGFADAEGLAGQLVRLFDPGCKELGSLREGANKESERRWEGEWDGVLGGLFGFVE